MTTAFLVAAVVLLAANAFFVAAEFAILAARRPRLEALAEAGDRRAAGALVVASDLNNMLAAAQVGITMASLGLGFVSEPAIGTLLESALHGADVPEGVSHAVSVALAIGIVSFFHLVLGEMVPKNIALVDPDRAVLVLAAPMRGFVAVFKPLIRLLGGAANLLLRPFGIEPRSSIVPAHTVEDLAVLVQSIRREGIVGEHEHRLLSGALGFRSHDAESVMVPRDRVVALSDEATPADFLRVMEESGHSRIPVYRRDLDDVTGFVHVKSLLDVAAQSMHRPIPTRLVRRLLVVSNEHALPDVLFEMRRAGVHVALVADVAGHTSGLVTLEDVLEELVGEIRDEYDRQPPRAGSPR